WRKALDVLRSGLDVISARAAHAAGNSELAKEHLQRAEARVRSTKGLLGAQRPDGDDPAGLQSVELRIALLLAERMLECATPQSPRATSTGALQDVQSSAPGAMGELVMESRGHWVQLPSGERIHWERHPVARPILVRLAQERLNAPRRPVPTQELIAI